MDYIRYNGIYEYVGGISRFLQYIDEGFTRFLDTLGENPEKKNIFYRIL